MIEKNMKNAISLIFPHQLYKNNPILSNDRDVFLVEEPRFFTDFNFHKQKLVLHRASMKFYADFIKLQHKIIYINLDQVEQFYESLPNKGIKAIHIIDPVDHHLDKKIKQLCKKHSLKLIIQENPGFFTPRSEIEELFEGKERFLMASFYIKQRKKLQILVDKNQKPFGGKWSFDAENRKPLTKNSSIAHYYIPKHNEYVLEAIDYVNTHFGSNPGTAQQFWFATTFEQAEKALADFLHKRFIHFGDYEDAIDPNHPVLFHSVLSPIINIGLLTPAHVIAKALEHAQKHSISLNNLEGFIRQIIGWREYMRAMYYIMGQEQSKQNFWHHERPLSSKFWSATTGIEPVDITINNVLNNAYAHHIERLMVLGNFMLLCQTKPDDVYEWFMELFIDAYDWVMIPNVYGMSQYADGGTMITKPYISGSHYLKKMSSFKTGTWCTIWDALYWHFIAFNEAIIAHNPRLIIMSQYLKRMQKTILKKHITSAEKFLDTLN